MATESRTPAASLGFGAMLDHVQDLLRSVWQRRWTGIAVAWIVLLLGAVILLRTPDRYEASAKVYVDTKSVLKPLMRDLAVQPDVSQTLGMLSRTIITRPNVELIVKRSGQELPTIVSEDQEALIERLMRTIRIEGSGREGVFTFLFRDTDPERARVVVKNLVALFVESDRGAQARDAQTAREFIDEQLRTHETRLAEAENRLKDFKLRNMELSDPSGRDYVSRIGALTDELAKLNVELRAAEQSTDALRRETGGEQLPALVPETPDTVVGLATPEIDSRLDAQRRQLDELLRRYTELHPDVISTRRLITRLEEQKQQEIEARKRAMEQAPKRVQAANGAAGLGQQAIRLALAEAEGKVAALRVRASETQSRLARLRADANRIPQVEAELAQLNRDYEVVRRNYEALVVRREQASMSQGLDATSRQEYFRVIDPPRANDKAVFPSRRMLAPMVIVLALVAGALASLIKAQLVPTFDSAKLLRSFSQRQILGSVSRVATPESERAARRGHLAFSSAFGALLLVGAAWTAWMSLAGGA